MVTWMMAPATRFTREDMAIFTLSTPKKTQFSFDAWTFFLNPSEFQPNQYKTFFPCPWIYNSVFLKLDTSSTNNVKTVETKAPPLKNVLKVLPEMTYRKGRRQARLPVAKPDCRGTWRALLHYSSYDVTIGLL